MTQLWSEADKRLSVVPRWAIVNTIQKQTVSDHCFRVARLVARKATKFGLTDAEKASAIELALHHDDDEHVTGDIPSIAKKYLNKVRLHKDHPAHISPYPNAHHLVKVMDKVEALIFLKTEMALGNATVKKVYEHVEKALLEYCQRRMLLHWHREIEAELAAIDVITDPME